MEWKWDLISYSLIHKQSHFSLSLSFCERRSSKYVHFLMTAGLSSATDTGPRASWWLFAHIPLLNVHPEPWICYFDISYKRIFYPPLPPLQPSNYSKGWWNHLCVINYRMTFSLKACVRLFSHERLWCTNISWISLFGIRWPRHISVCVSTPGYSCPLWLPVSLAQPLSTVFKHRLPCLCACVATL